MKNMYVCEKCNRMFEDFEEAERHEESHFEMVTTGWDEMVPLLEYANKQTEYEKDSFEPTKLAVLLRSERWDKDHFERNYRIGF